MWTVRYLLPAALIVAGLICLLVAPDSSRVEGWALFTGSGLSVLLLNVLFRIGTRGDVERGRDEDAREYFTEHGEWPIDVQPTPGKRKWHLPEGVVTPEDEERMRSE